MTNTTLALWLVGDSMTELDPSPRLLVREHDETHSFKLRRSPEAVLAVFTETNEHMRNAEQKQLSVTGAYLGMLAVVLSLVPTGGIALVDTRPEAAFVYVFMWFVGCCVYLLQAWCRVWKEHYHQVLRNIAQTWLLPEDLLPYWLRNLPAPPPGTLGRINVHNTLVYCTWVLNTLVIALVVHEALVLLTAPAGYVVATLLTSAYVAFLIGVRRLSENRRNMLRA